MKYTKIAFCIIVLLLLNGCTPRPVKEEHVGVYRDERYEEIYVVRLEDNDIAKLFELDPPTDNMTCFDQNGTFCGTVHFSKIIDGGYVGWDDYRFVYIPDYRGVLGGAYAANYLCFDKKEAMSFEDGCKYIPSLKSYAEKNSADT